MDAVWRYFDEGERHYGRAWPVHYRTSETERLDTLRALGVRAFPALVYPHKPGMAESLSEWAMAFAAHGAGVRAERDVLRRAKRGVLRAARGGSRGSNVQGARAGGRLRPARIRCCDQVWGLLAEAAVPVVVHCGSGPIPGRHTGPGPFGEVLAAGIRAHGGDRTLRRARSTASTSRFRRALPNVHVDTTMVGTEYMNSLAPLPAETIARLGDLGDRVVLGTDFPNIPYPYATQLAALEAFGHGDDWLRAVCWDNGARLLGVA